jgi:hypothetical protein
MVPQSPMPRLCIDRAFLMPLPSKPSNRAIRPLKRVPTPPSLQHQRSSQRSSWTETDTSSPSGCCKESAIDPFRIPTPAAAPLLLLSASSTGRGGIEARLPRLTLLFSITQRLMVTLAHWQNTPVRSSWMHRHPSTRLANKRMPFQTSLLRHANQQAIRTTTRSVDLRSITGTLTISASPLALLALAGQVPP